MSTEAKPLEHLAKALYPKGSQCSKEIKVVFLGLGGVGKVGYFPPPPHTKIPFSPLTCDSEYTRGTLCLWDVC